MNYTRTQSDAARPAREDPDRLCTTSILRAASRWVAASMTALALSTAPLAVSMNDARSPDALAQQFVAAVLSNRLEQRKSIIHSSTLACMNPQTQPYFDWIFSKQLRIVANAGKPKITVTPIGKAPVLLPPDGRSDYPVLPTHQIEIDFVTAPYRSSSVVLFVAQDGSQWREVLPCPRGDVIAQSRAKQIVEQKDAMQARSLSDSMPAALRKEMRDLLKDGRKVEAIRRYSAATGVDISTAKAVIQLLEPVEASK